MSVTVATPALPGEPMIQTSWSWLMRFGALCFLVLLSTVPNYGQSPAPVMEFGSVLSGLRIRHSTGVLELESANHALATVFLPAGTAVEAVVTRKGSTRVLGRQRLAVSGQTGVFSRVSVRGDIQQIAVTDPGEYVLTYLAGGKPMSTLEFRVERFQNEDQFDPKTFYYLAGPHDKWAYLYAPLPDSTTDQPEFRMWAHKRSFAAAPEADQYDVELQCQGDVVGVSSTGFVSSKEGQQLRFPWRDPDSKGGRAMKVSDLVGRDGTYAVVVRKNDTPFGVWRFEVREGKPRFHPRQSHQFAPRTNYIVPRVSGLSDQAPGAVVFMERLSAKEASEMLAGDSPRVIDPTAEDRKRWEWMPRSIDPKRPFELTVSSVETRSDTHLAVGEDLVVFGTGFPNGVQYLIAGESEARQIPRGETFSAQTFTVCGRKIVLTQRHRVFVFDTEAEQLFELPEAEISLYDPSNLRCAADGYLVATVNRATAVKDKTILKVIDLSGPEPGIIPIKNADYLDRDVTAVGLSAKYGVIAVSSRSKKQIAVAPIAPLADQTPFHLAEYRGVASFGLGVEDDAVVYADDDWKVRRLSLSSGSSTAITEAAISRSGNGFWVRKGRLVTTTATGKVGSRYPITISDSDDPPQLAAGTGEQIAGTSAQLGLGGSAAIASDKTVFIAGTPGDSIGTGERLQMLAEGRWHPVPGEDGEPVWGSDVVTSTGFLALKVRDAAGKTVVGYATYGERISLADVQSASERQGARGPLDGMASRERADSRPSPAKPLPPGKLSETPGKLGETPGKLSEIEEAFIAAMLESEEQLMRAFSQAFGEKAAKQRILEGWKKTLASSNREHLLDELLRRSQVFQSTE